MIMMTITEEMREEITAVIQSRKEGIANECLMFLRAAKKTSQDISISEPIELDKHGNELTLLDVIADEDNFADNLDYRQDLLLLRNFLASAPDTREMRVLRLRYGLDGSKPLTQKEIAASMGISRSYISRLETRALQWLREQFSKVEG
ncbi:MAG: helix-turn-helix domain-containing protein [Ruminococcaceae bacterium]|nr:helix-turn-helix domain-containing protein [Oscillospiraceae bacterium]